VFIAEKAFAAQKAKKNFRLAELNLTMIGKLYRFIRYLFT